jgi:hypothetical protein
MSSAHPGPPRHEETEMERPPFDPTALVLGLLFSVVAVVGLLDPDVARRIDLEVVIPLTLVVGGSALLLGAARPRRGADRERGGPQGSA